LPNARDFGGDFFGEHKATRENQSNSYRNKSHVSISLSFPEAISGVLNGLFQLGLFR